MGVSHSYNFLLKLQQKWSILKGHWSLIDIDKYYYIVIFDLKEVCTYVLCGGPWIITGHYLAIQKWKPYFHAAEEHITKLTVRVRVSGLHVEWFDHQVMHHVGKLLGTTHRVIFAR